MYILYFPLKLLFPDVSRCNSKVQSSFVGLLERQKFIHNTDLRIFIIKIKIVFGSFLCDREGDVPAD